MPPPELDPRLAALTDRIRACRICVERPLGKPLPHEPRPVLSPSSAARILIAGQAPGTRVHGSGLSFTDASGDRLRNWLGVSPEDFYDPSLFAIAAMGFCFPGQDASGGDLPPRRECAPTWRQALMAEMPQVDLVLAIGAHAQAWHMPQGRGRTMTETVARWRAEFDPKAKPAVIPLPHPSWRNTGWIRRNPWFEAELIPALRVEVARRLSGI